MRRRNKSDQAEVEHFERNFPRDKPRLSELVFVTTWHKDQPGFSVMLTRVPSVAERLENEGLIYQITGVTHYPVDADGRSRFGWHAMLDLELIPEEDVGITKRKRK